MALRVSEKEAVARGWISPPPPKLEPKRRIPPSLGFTYFVLFVLGWLVGFAMSIMFRVC